MSLIEIKNLYKVFGANPMRAIQLINKGLSKGEILKKTGCTIAINGASFAIEKGETFVVMGLSGSGKSTFIRCLNRLVNPTSGEILIDGQDIMKMSIEALRGLRRKKMSMVFQHFGLLPHRTVLKNVEFGLEISGLEQEERTKKAQEAIETVGLKGFEHSFPDQLSGGMQQRVGLARALANNPEILLMDEAFSALDPLIRTQMQDELLDLQAKMHKTIVFITHDLDEALKIGDRIAILGPDGRVRQIGTPEEILSSPADDYVKRFIQNVNASQVLTASTLKFRASCITYPREDVHAAMRIMEQKSISSVYVLDHERKLKGLVTIEDVQKLYKKGEKDIGSIIINDLYTTKEDTPIASLFATAMKTSYPIAIVEDDNTFHGAVSKAAIVAEMTKAADDDNLPQNLRTLTDTNENLEETE